jgi:hypothetical protein
VETGYQSSTYYPISATDLNGIVTIEGSLFEQRLFISVDAHNTYHTVIDDVTAAYGKTATLKDSGDAYWAYEFGPSGEYVDLNNPDHFLSIFHLADGP